MRIERILALANECELYADRNVILAFAGLLLAEDGNLSSLASQITLDQTCGACPEQYDAYYNGKQVGYLRLRHGYFRVDCPDCGGETIFEADPNGDGCFEDDEREYYLNQARKAIAKWIKENTNE